MEGQRASSAARGGGIGGKVDRFDLFGPGLGDLPVLAEFAVDVAARRRQGQGRRARQDVEERLLLDGIDVEAADLAVDQRVIGPADVLADAAIAPLLVAEPAEAGAEPAFDLAVGELHVVTGFDPGQIGSAVPSAVRRAQNDGSPAPRARPAPAVPRRKPRLFTRAPPRRARSRPDRSGRGPSSRPWRGTSAPVLPPRASAGRRRPGAAR